MKYRVGLPLWRLAYRLGMTLYYRAVIRKDRSDNVFYVASSDIHGALTFALIGFFRFRRENARKIAEQFIPQVAIKKDQEHQHQ